MPLSARRAPPSAAPASPVSSSDAAGSVSVRRSAFLPLDPLLGARLGDLPDGVEVVGEDDDRLLLEIAALQERAELLDLRVRRARREVDHPPEGVLLRRARIALHAARDPLDSCGSLTPAKRSGASTFAAAASSSPRPRAARSWKAMTAA